MSSIFSKIVTGDIPCYKVAENDDHLAFLDINPLALGHTLVIPKKETDYIFDIEDQEFMELWQFAKQVANKMEGKFNCERIGIAVIGLEVPHAHIHLVPINGVSDIDFSRPKLQLTNEEFIEVVDKINA